jgi:ABC-type sugar transport system substrate-binding protein
VRTRVVVAAAATLLLSLTAASPAAADRAVRLKKPAPPWYTPQLHAQLVEAGAKAKGWPTSS